MKVRPLLVFLLASLAFPRSAPAQLVIGQYEDEAPQRSWNAFGVPAPVSLALGEARFALVSDASAALVNPALLSRLERFTLALSASYGKAEFYRYGIVNTGPVSSEENLRAGLYALEFGGASIRRGRWAFALAAGLVEDYGRPEVRTSYTSRDTLVYTLLWRQTGLLRVFNASVAFDFGGGVSAGLGLNLAAGRHERSLREEYPADGVVITDERTRDLRGGYVNAGLAWRARPGLLFGLVFRSPCAGKADGRSVLGYEASGAGTDIRIDGSASDTFRRPWVAGAGFSWAISRRFRAAADAAFFAWSTYRAEDFGEPLPRDFRNILRAGGGLEYSAFYRLGGRQVRMPFRVGFLLDPQPMKTPRSAYACLTFGTGLELGRFRLDGAAQVGRESGSGRALSVARLAIGLIYAVEEPR